MAESSTILPGTLEMLILKTLCLEPMHGWGIMERIEQVSRGVFSLNQGSLYPALERALRAGLVKSEWRITENGRRARYYAITRAGTTRLEAERRDWERSSHAINLILRSV
jgi:PadR family transcriptional regulator, regulatory protein PadR